MKKFVRSVFITLSLGLLFSDPYMPMADAAAHFDDTLNAMAFAKLPTCQAGTANSRATINDASAASVAFNAVVSGGGNGTASVFCDGSSWKFVAGGGSGGGPATTVVLAAPITPNTVDSSNLNYQTGCTGGLLASTFANHSCLMFDDHWTTTPTGNTPISDLNHSNWYAGYMRCNGGSGGNANCLNQVFDSVVYPFTGWCYSNANGTACYDDVLYDFPIGNPTNPSSVPTPTLQIASDGTLQMGIGFYSNATAIALSRCVTTNVNEDCSAVNWIGSAITTGGLVNLNGDNNLPSNLNTLIPANGGMMQWRMKTDAGVNIGSWPGFECDLVDPTNGINASSANVNMEWGYNNSGQTLGTQGIGQGNANVDNQSEETINGSISGTTMNVTGTNATIKVNTRLSGAGIVGGTRITALGTGNGGPGTYILNNANTVPPGSTFFGRAVVTTGDDGVGSGDVTNWHTYAVEWTGTATHQWNYYVDGIPLPVGGNANSHTQALVPSGSYPGFTCGFTTGLATPTQASFHTQWTANTGPFNIWVSDIQIYKKPGT